jgi:hypothetical protein
MAGAVMAFTLRLSPMSHCSPISVKKEYCAKLWAINHARDGKLSGALSILGIKHDQLSHDQVVAVIESSVSIERSLSSSRFMAVAPPKVYLRAADALEAIGL